MSHSYAVCLSLCFLRDSIPLLKSNMQDNIRRLKLRDCKNPPYN